MSYEEEDTCVSYEEEDACVSYEEEGRRIGQECSVYMQTRIHPLQPDS